MQFEREGPGVYRFLRKKVFMKLEGETIVLRVGGGFLTLDEFIELHCGQGDGIYDSQDSLGLGHKKQRVTSLVYAGNCSGDRDFKAFHMTQQKFDTSARSLSKFDDQTVSNYGQTQKFQSLTAPTRTTEKKKKSKSALIGHTRIPSRATLLSGSNPQTRQPGTPTHNTLYNSCTTLHTTNKTALAYYDSKRL